MSEQSELVQTTGNVPPYCRSGRTVVVRKLTVLNLVAGRHVSLKGKVVLGEHSRINHVTAGTAGRIRFKTVGDHNEIWRWIYLQSVIVFPIYRQDLKRHGGQMRLADDGLGKLEIFFLDSIVDSIGRGTTTVNDGDRTYVLEVLLPRKTKRVPAHLCQHILSQYYDLLGAVLYPTRIRGKDRVR